jgi:hypothetical protein
MSVTIESDKALREALTSLSLEARRQLGARFVTSVSHLSSNPVLTQGLEVIANTDRTDAELDNAFQNVRNFSIKSYTACGQDADWLAQAEHFVAAALSVCLTPESQITGENNLAWKAAMQARMARNCEMIDRDQGEVENEAARQYQTVMEFVA